MRTTKNVYVKENGQGFVVTNNYETVAQRITKMNEAIEMATEIANKENKDVVVKTDYYNETIKIKK